MAVPQARQRAIGRAAAAQAEDDAGPNKEAMAARRAYLASAASNNDEAAASATRRAPGTMAARHTVEANDIDDGALDEGSYDDKAASIAARRAYVVKPPPTTTRQRSLPGGPLARWPDARSRPTLAPQGARTRQAPPSTTTRQRPLPQSGHIWRAPPSYGGRANEIWAFGYGDGAPRDDNKAAAFAARLVRATMAARCTGDEEAAAVALTTDNAKDNDGASLQRQI